MNSSWSDWIWWGVCTLMFLLAMWLFGLVPILLGLALLAAGVCALYHILIERKLESERAKALAKAEGLLKTLRLRGLEEEALREFVAKYSGDHWEELYEALFGYDLMIRARQHLVATTGKRRTQHASWRDPIIKWLEIRPQLAKERRERRLLKKIEQKKLEAEGISRAEAESRASAAAEVMVEAAAGMKQAFDETLPHTSTTDAAVKPPKPLFNAKKLMEAAARAEKEHATRLKPKGPGLIKTLYALILGPQPRFLVATVLIFGCLLWLHQNPQVIEKAKSLTDKGLNLEKIQLENVRVQSKPLTLPGLPEFVSKAFNSFNPGIAGLLLILSSVWRSPRITFFFFPAVALLVFGPQFGVPGFPVPVLGDVPPETVSLAGGLVLMVVGIVVDRLLSRGGPDPRRW